MSNSSFSGLLTASYVKMAIHLFGVVTNIISVIVFMNPKLKDTSYRLMMSKSTANAIYLAISFEIELLSNCVNCEWSGSFGVIWNQIAFGVVVLSVLAIFRVLLDVAISVYTFCILINKPWPGKYTYIAVLLLIGVLSVLYSLQKAFLLTIIQLPSGKYMYSYTSYGLSSTSATIQIASSCVRIFIAVVVVGAINILNMVKFSLRFKSRIFATVTSKHSSMIFIILEFIGC